MYSLRKLLLGRYAKLQLLYRASSDGWNCATAVGTAAQPGKICGKGPTLHVVVTPEGIFGGYASRPWSCAGAYVADSASFVWSAVGGGFRKFVAAGPANHMYFNTDRVAFGHAHAIYLPLNGMSAAYVKADPNHFSGLGAQSLHPKAPSSISYSDFLVFTVLDEDEYTGGISVGGAWTAGFRDELVRQVKEWRPYAPSCPNADLQKVNLLVVGRMGVGKSSWLNTVITTVRGVPTQILESEPSPSQVTTAQRTLAVRGVQLTIRDLPGWDDEVDWPTYQRMLRCVVRGQARDQEQLQPINRDFLVELEDRDKAPFEEQIHVIAVLRPSRHASPDYEAKIKSIVDEYKGTCPVIALLTKADEQLPASSDLSLAYCYDDILKARSDLAQGLGMDAYRILPVVSYSGPLVYPSVPAEIMALKVLQLVQALGEKAIDKHHLLLAQRRARASPAARAPQANATPTPAAVPTPAPSPTPAPAPASSEDSAANAPGDDAQFCTGCGRQRRPGDAFCGGCGKRQ